MRGFSVWLRLLIISLFLITVTCVYGAEENIALKAKVEVSSTYNDTYVGENAIDGNNDQNTPNTRWLSGKQDAPGKESDPPHWLILDFDKPMTIVRMSLYFYTDWAPVEYVIQYEKGGKWVDIPGTQVKDGKREEITREFNISPVGAKRLRFYCTDGSSYDKTWGNIVRLAEIEVYSTGSAAVRKLGNITTTWGNIKFGKP